MAELRTSITDIPIANDDIIREVARMTKSNIGEIEDIINFVGTYTADVIRKGNMEAVMIPYFGKFKVKLEKLRAFKKIAQGRNNGKDMIYAARVGRKIIDRRINKEDNETI